jgi:chromosome segregation protein
MTYIKRLVMKGFKSFARETVMNMDRHMNVIVGPNGSGKSNVTDALCFVLGRLSIKSIRAAKASHLIFSGNKNYKACNEAYVEIVFDNEDKSFALDTNEIIIRRIVRKNGQSIYKISNDVKTRQEIIELLAQSGIDPHGFNIILQGEIEKFVKMPPDERRKVIEEVAGISVYEMRKEKSLKEFEKTEDKLREINAILKERTNYLKNLENEREQALKFKKLEETIQRCKASILYKNISEKEKELSEVLKKIELKKHEIQKKENSIQKIKLELDIFNSKIDSLSRTIQQSSGLEQDTLLSEISILKQEIAGMIARKENYENQLLELERRRQSLLDSVKYSEMDISNISKQSDRNTKEELEKKKKKLEEIDEQKRESYLIKSNLSSTIFQIEDKKRNITRLKNESNFLLDKIEETEREIKIYDSLEKHHESLIGLRQNVLKNNERIKVLENELLEKEKEKAVQNHAIIDFEKIKNQVSKLDICPLCKTKITKEHIQEVVVNSETSIENSKKIIIDIDEEINKTKKELLLLKDELLKNLTEIHTREVDILKLKTISEKKYQLTRNNEQITLLENETKSLEHKKKSLEDKYSGIKINEENYETLKLEIEELSRTQERNSGLEISTKQRELERTKIAIKQNLRDKEDIIINLKEIVEVLVDKQKLCHEKEKQAEVLKLKYQKLFEEKNELQDKSRILETTIMREQNEKRFLENDNNDLMIQKAQINAKRETFLQEFKVYENIELISMNLESLKEKLAQTEQAVSRIGSVNMKALEVYDEIKNEYDRIKEKVDHLGKEKEEIIKIIEQIDRKKRKAFMHTLEKLNELFTRNFLELSSKGIVTLEPQDKKEIFNAGIDILVKVGGGKYFDVTSLSGGEQTLVALSLIFAIQEFRPYCFYIFDEIDAALDRRNSEKLAYLLKKHIKQGQYFIITHNDSIISDSSDILYGVSMQEGISKILTLKI